VYVSKYGLVPGKGKRDYDAETAAKYKEKDFYR
jgi:hypothetical protein